MVGPNTLGLCVPGVGLLGSIAPSFCREGSVAVLCRSGTPDAIRQVLNEAVDPEAVLMHFASTVTDDESKVLRSGLNRRKRRR